MKVIIILLRKILVLVNKLIIVITIMVITSNKEYNYSVNIINICQLTEQKEQKC